jgi:hypothetical protein
LASGAEPPACYRLPRRAGGVQRAPTADPFASPSAPDPGLIPANPGLIPADPGLIPADPGLIPADPGLIPAEPDLSWRSCGTATSRKRDVSDA